MNRANRIVGHLEQCASLPNASANPTAASSADDIVIVSAKRTPIGRAKKGSFKDTHPAELLAHALKAVVDDSKIDAALVDDVVVGNVLNPGEWRCALFCISCIWSQKAPFSIYVYLSL